MPSASCMQVKFMGNGMSRPGGSLSNQRSSNGTNSSMLASPRPGDSMPAHRHELGMTQFGHRRGRSAVDFDHLEIVLGDAAIRARPRVRDVLPASPRLYAFFRKAGLLVVDETAHHAHELAVSDGGFG